MNEILRLYFRHELPARSWCDSPTLVIPGRVPIIGVADTTEVIWFEPLGPAELMSYTWMRRAMPDDVVATRVLEVAELVLHEDRPDPSFGCRSCGGRFNQHTPACSYIRAHHLSGPRLPWVCSMCGRLHMIPGWYAPGPAKLTHPCPCGQHFNLVPLWGAPAFRVLSFLQTCAVAPERPLDEVFQGYRDVLRVFGLVAPISLTVEDRARIEHYRRTST